MKYVLLLFLLISTSSAVAKDKLWFSNKVEAGYGRVFISETVTFKEGLFTKNAFGAGLKFKISDNVKYKTFYLLENKRKHNWAKGHFLGAAIEFKLK
tara:strand:- start:1368 stop:1658 length:291 start_codon:yes stop_codon:yes gene_type:complete